MVRRLGRVVLSDDEEDNETVAAPTTSHDGTPSSLPPIPPTNANPSPTTPSNISDEDQDDFSTVPDEFAPSSPPALSTSPPPVPSTNNTQNANSNSRTTPIDQFLRSLGLCIRHEWLEACSDRISGTMHCYDGLADDAKAMKIFEQFLFADLNECGAGVLPENIGMMHKAELDGPFVLQVDEVVNISAPIKERYQKAPAGLKRCLKLSMKDGVQHVFGIEYRPIKELEVLAPSGFKMTQFDLARLKLSIVVRNVQVRRGLLMLVPEIITFLGGLVDDLDQARQRLVSEVNKPPRGTRKQGGIPLSRRASLAAWSANIGTGITDDFTERNATSIPAPQRTNSDQLARPTHSPATASGVTIDARNTNPNIRPNQMQEITVEEVDNSHEDSSLFNQSRDSEQMRTRGPHVSAGSSINCSHEPSVMNEEAFMSQKRDSEQLRGGGNPNVMGERFTSVYEEPCTGHRRRDLVQLHGKAPPPSSFRGTTIEENDMVVDEEPSVNNWRGSEQMTSGDSHVSDRSMATRGSDMANDDEANDTLMDFINDDAMDVELENSPFTYMSSLQAQWDPEESRTKPFIRGRIKCFLTGVKSKFGFQGKFDLEAYIDDGSLISLVKIDHNVIQKRIGHTPEEVVSAIKSSNPETEADMRQTMRNFQDFLRQFEGTMVIEINASSDLPIAIEMNQGCSSDGASLLFRRLEAMEQ